METFSELGEAGESVEGLQTASVQPMPTWLQGMDVLGRPQPGSIGLSEVARRGGGALVAWDWVDVEVGVEVEVGVGAEVEVEVEVEGCLVE